MKKNLLVLAALLMMSSVVFARDPENPSPASGVGIMKKGTSFHVYYKGVKPLDVKVSIFNARKQLVYTETIRKTDGFMRPYNFEQLEYGEYILELWDGTQRQTQTILHGVKPIEKLAHLTRIAGSDNKFILAVPNKGHDVLTIKIYSEKNQLIYQELLETAHDFAKVYNLNKLKGNFSFQVTDREGNIKVLSY
jgi:hypothetical protein